MTYTERRKDKITRELIDELGGKMFTGNMGGMPIDIIVLGSVRPAIIKVLGATTERRYIDLTRENHYLVDEAGVFKSVVAAEPLEEGLYERLTEQYPEHIGQITTDLAGVLKRAVNHYVKQVGDRHGKSATAEDADLMERTENLRDAADLVQRLAEHVSDIGLLRETARFNDSFARQLRYLKGKLQ